MTKPLKQGSRRSRSLSRAAIRRSTSVSLDAQPKLPADPLLDLGPGPPGGREDGLAEQARGRRFGVDVAQFPRIAAIEAACAGLEPFRRALPELQPDARR